MSYLYGLNGAFDQFIDKAGKAASNVSAKDVQNAANQVQTIVQGGAASLNSSAGGASGAGISIEKIEPFTVVVGLPVIVKGNGFMSGAQVRFDNIPVVTTVFDAKTIQVIVPDTTAGIKSVKVINPDGKSADAKDAVNVTRQPGAEIAMKGSTGPSTAMIAGGVLAAIGVAYLATKKG